MDGVLIVDKPVGMTSHDVVARVRRILRERRVGHTGTLDPFATGVLVLLIGKATRLAQFLSNAEKEYEAVVRLGYATTTGDRTGERIEPGEKVEAGNEGAGKEGRPFCAPTQSQIQAALENLKGEIEQVPPMYSAKKVEGRKLYEFARRGEVVERKPAKVTIKEFEAETRDDYLISANDDGTFDLAVRVVCSAGTYIRVLAEDFGSQLGLQAHLAELRRIRAGKFLVKDATTMEQLQQIVRETLLGNILVPPDAALSHLPFLHLSAADVQRTRNGVPLRPEVEIAAAWANRELVRLRDVRGELLAVSSFDSESGLLRPQVVLAAQN